MKKIFIKGIIVQLAMLSLTACNGSSSPSSVNSAGQNVIAGLENGNVYQGPNLLGKMSPDTTPITVVAVNSGNIYSGTFGSNMIGGAVYQLKNGAWINVAGYYPNGTGYTVPDNTAVSALAFNTSSNLFAASLGSLDVFAGSIWQLNNSAWIQVNGKPPLVLNAITSIAFDSNSNLYAGAATFGGNVFESVAGSWNWVNQSSLPDFVSKIALDSNNNLYAALSNGSVYESSAGAWNQINSALESSVTSIVIDKHNNLYVGIDSWGLNGGGVYESVSGNWQKVNGAAPDGYSINALALDQNNNIYAGTASGNVFESQSGQWVLLINYGTPVNSIAINP